VVPLEGSKSVQRTKTAARGKKRQRGEEKGQENSKSKPQENRKRERSQRYRHGEEEPQKKRDQQGDGNQAESGRGGQTSASPHPAIIEDPGADRSVAGAIFCSNGEHRDRPTVNVLSGACSRCGAPPGLGPLQTQAINDRPPATRSHTSPRFDCPKRAISIVSPPPTAREDSRAPGGQGLSRSQGPGPATHGTLVTHTTPAAPFHRAMRACLGGRP